MVDKLCIFYIGCNFMLMFLPIRICFGDTDLPKILAKHD